MQAQREFPPSLSDVKDKFLVQYCTVDATMKEVAMETFDVAGGREVKQTKLRVVLVRHPLWAGLIPWSLPGMLRLWELRGHRAIVWYMLIVIVKSGSVRACNTWCTR